MVGRDEQKFLNDLHDAAFEDDDTVAKARIDCILSTNHDSVMAAALLFLVRKCDEYEHALRHVAEDSPYHKPSACKGCQMLARGALRTE